MVAVLRFTILAVLAVAHQGFAAEVINITIPGIFGGGTYDVNSLSGQELGGEIGVGIKISGQELTKNIALGPMGGVQSKFMSPLLPKIGEIMENVNKEVDNVGKNINSFLSNPLKAIQDTFSKIGDDINNTINGILKLELKLSLIEDLQKTLNGVLSNIPGVPTLEELVQNIEGLLNQLLQQGSITQQEMLSIGASFFQSSINKVENPLALLTDVLETATKLEIITDIKKALNVLLTGVKQNLASTTKTANEAVGELLTSVSGILGEDVVSKLKSLLTDITENVSAVVDDATGTVVNVVGQVEGIVDKTTSDLTNTVDNVVGDLTNTVDNVVGDLTNTVDNVVDTAGVEIKVNV